jgi:hypothetical protein
VLVLVIGTLPCYTIDLLVAIFAVLPIMQNSKDLGVGRDVGLSAGL